MLHSTAEHERGSYNSMLHNNGSTMQARFNPCFGYTLKVVRIGLELPTIASLVAHCAVEYTVSLALCNKNLRRVLGVHTCYAGTSGRIILCNSEGWLAKECCWLPVVVLEIFFWSPYFMLVIQHSQQQASFGKESSG